MRRLVNLGGATGDALPNADHVAQLKDVVRRVARLSAEELVLVQQLACTEPGCPPVQTVIALIGPPRRTWKFPKPTSEVSRVELQAELVAHPQGGIHADHD
ncbi:hypothetical protein [Mycolicibacterium setense]